MSYVTSPDPHPGRCPNFRSDGPPTFTSRRCLEREDDFGHVCRFDPPRPAVSQSSVGWSTGSAKPKPWVAPPPSSVVADSLSGWEEVQ